jgi:hypothetical protein
LADLSKPSTLKPLGQMNRNLVGSIYGKSSVAIAHFVPIDASYQVSVHLAEVFQRRRLKCEKLMDDRRRTTDAKWWQKLTLSLAKWTKNSKYAMWIALLDILSIHWKLKRIH